MNKSIKRTLMFFAATTLASSAFASTFTLKPTDDALLLVGSPYTGPSDTLALE